LRNAGTISFNNPTTSKLSFLANSLYNHAFTTVPGVIPNGSTNVTWNVASTCRISGYTTNATPPAGLGQAFGNFVWATESLDLNAGGGGGIFDLNGALSQVQTNLTIESTGQFGDALFLTASTPYSALAIDNFTVNGGFVALTSDADITFNVSQNFTIGASGIFAANIVAANASVDINGSLFVSGSFDLSAATGTTNLNIAGNITNTGVVQLTAGSANITFDGSSQSILNSLDFTSPASVNFQVGNGVVPTVLNIGDNYIRTDGNFLVNENSQLDIGVDGYIEGSGSFTLSENSILRVASTASAGAIQAAGPPYSGNIRTSGVRNYNSGSTSLPSTIVYNGTLPQFIGSGHPTAGGINTTINNTAGVTLASNVTIGGLLYLDNGNLSLLNRTLTMNDAFQADLPYALNVTSQSSISIGVGDAGPFGTLRTTGSTTINNLTFDRSGQDLTIGNNLTVNGTLTHNSNILFPGFQLDIKGPYTTTGGSLSGDNLSTLIISGSGTITGSVSLSGTLGTLTINRPVGVTNTTSITISTALNILSGTYQGSGSVTLSPGATLTRAEGTITKTLAVTDYNLIYTSGGAIITGSELVTSPSTALTNLTINSANSVTLNPALTEIHVGGNLNLLGGEFVSNGKGIFLEGNLLSNATGTFTGSLFTFAGNTTLDGNVVIELDDVELAAGATLNLGDAGTTVHFEGDIDSDNGGTWVAGAGTAIFAGTTVLTIDETNTPHFNNLSINPSSSLTISCSSCGTENNRPAITVAGTWNSNNVGAVFTPAPDPGSNVVTEVTFIGGTQSIAMLAGQSFWDLTLAGTGTLTLSQALTVANDLELAGTKTLSTGGGNQAISIGDDFLLSGGSFTPNTGTVTFNGGGNQVVDRLSGSGAVNFYNLTVNKTGGSFTNATALNLVNVFSVSSNTAIHFGTGSDTFTLISTSARTAGIGSLAAVSSPATNITGTVVVQRYMDAEGRIFRYISSPVSAPTSELLDDFPITGTFTGNTTCSFFQPGEPNMFLYNQALPGAFDARYVAFPSANISEQLAPGRGYSVKMCDGASTITWDVTGTINRGNVSLPVSYNNTGVPGADGFNLVGNPYPCVIDWNDADWTKTNISGTFYTRDNGTGAGGGNGGGVYASFNGVTGTNGGTKNIAVGQAFWVEATASSPVLTAREGVKLTNLQPIYFREAAPENLLRMALMKDADRDEAVIHFRNDATSAFDPQADAKKMFNDIFSFSTFNQDSLKMSINSVEALNCTKEFGIDMRNTTPGSYTIAFSEFESFNKPVKIYLVDTYLNRTQEIAESPTYEFDIDTNPLSSGSKRFRVLISLQNIDTEIAMEGSNSCAAELASVRLNDSEPGVSYYATSNGKILSQEFTGTGSGISLMIPADKLAVGENDLIVFARMGQCPAVPMVNAVTVNYDRIYTPVVSQPGIVCREGSATLKSTGAPANGMYRWYESLNSTTLLAEEDQGEYQTPPISKSKSYFVSIVNNLGCEGTRMEVKAEVVKFDDARLAVSDNILISNFDAGNTWYFNDELIEGQNGSELVMNQSGEYRLEVLFSGGCKTTASFSFRQDEAVTEPISVYPNPAQNEIRVRVKSLNQVEGQIMNAAGQRMEALQFVTENGTQTATMDIGHFTQGVYLIKVLDGQKTLYKKLVKN
jgi:hypothetical protein